LDRDRPGTNARTKYARDQGSVRRRRWRGVSSTSGCMPMRRWCVERFCLAAGLWAGANSTCVLGPMGTGRWQRSCQSLAAISAANPDNRTAALANLDVRFWRGCDGMQRAIPDAPGWRQSEKFAVVNPTRPTGSTRNEISLRRKPFGQLLPSAHGRFDRECRLSRDPADRGWFPIPPPPPRPIALCTDESVGRGGLPISWRWWTRRSAGTARSRRCRK